MDSDVPHIVQKQTLFCHFSVCGSDASVEWELEGRRVVPLMPRLVPQTAFTGSATAAANHAANVNSTIPSTTKGTRCFNPSLHHLWLSYSGKFRENLLGR
jgi:hypothetical protein